MNSITDIEKIIIMEFALFCLGIIIMTCFVVAIILDHKLKQHEKKQFNKNLNRLNNDTDRLR
jgi:hypothetical protein